MRSFRRVVERESAFERFEPIADELIFIAENGCYVVDKGIELSSDCLDLSTARALIGVYRELRRREGDIGFRNIDDYQSAYRQILDYFDAVKVALTATRRRSPRARAARRLLSSSSMERP